MRKKATLTALAMMAWATMALAQAKPDFSGTWILDVEKSELGGASGGSGSGGPGGGPSRAPSPALDAKFVITQTASELSIDQQVGGHSNVITFKLDGSESANTGMRGGQLKSKARWDGDRIVVESTQAMTTPNGERTLETKEVRSLAADGTMVVERTTQTPRGTRTQKLVFKKTT
jgi:hypothetical protein